MGTVQDEGTKGRRKERRSEERKTSWLGFHLQFALESKHRLERNLERNQLHKGLYLDNRRPCTGGVLQDNSTQHQQSGRLPWAALPCSRHVGSRTDVEQSHALPQLSGLPLLVVLGKTTTRAQVAPRVSTQWDCMVVFVPGRIPVQTGLCRKDQMGA